MCLIINIFHLAKPKNRATDTSEDFTKTREKGIAEDGRFVFLLR